MKSDKTTPEAVEDVMLSDATVFSSTALDERAQSIKLRDNWSPWLFGMMVVQLAVVDFIVFSIGIGWIDYQSQSVMLNIFVGSTFVQICGLVYVVVKHLFPQRN